MFVFSIILRLSNFWKRNLILKKLLPNLFNADVSVFSKILPVVTGIKKMHIFLKTFCFEWIVDYLVINIRDK